MKYILSLVLLPLATLSYTQSWWATEAAKNKEVPYQEPQRDGMIYILPSRDIGDLDSGINNPSYIPYRARPKLVTEYSTDESEELSDGFNRGRGACRGTGSCTVQESGAGDYSCAGIGSCTDQQTGAGYQSCKGTGSCTANSSGSGYNSCKGTGSCTGAYSGPGKESCMGPGSCSGAKSGRGYNSCSGTGSCSGEGSGHCPNSCSQTGSCSSANSCQ